MLSASLLVPSAQASTSPWSDESFLTQALAGIRAAGNDHFAVAESVFTELSRRYPESPLGPLLAAGAIQSQMLDAEASGRKLALDHWLHEADLRAGATLQIAPSAEAEFALGTAAGYRAVYESHWGGRFAALKYGLRAKGHFERAFRLDTTCYDALLGMGAYNYWKSARLQFLNWLPFVPDQRRLGLAQLMQAATQGTFTREAARSILAWTLIHEERYGEAWAQADTLLRICPEGKAPLWIMAQAAMKLYQWDSARVLYTEIERRILSEGPGNYFNLIECAYYRARCDQEAGHWREALAECHQALAYPLLPDMRARQKGRLAELRRIQKNLKQKVTATETAGSLDAGLR